MASPGRLKTGISSGAPTRISDLGRRSATCGARAAPASTLACHEHCQRLEQPHGHKGAAIRGPQTPLCGLRTSRTPPRLRRRVLSATRRSIRAWRRAGGSTRWSRNAGAAHQSPSASASTSRPCRVLGDIGAPRSSPLRASWSRSHLDRVTYVSRDAALCFLGPILDPRAPVDVCSSTMS